MRSGLVLMIVLTACSGRAPTPVPVPSQDVVDVVTLCSSGYTAEARAELEAAWERLGGRLSAEGGVFFSGGDLISREDYDKYVQCLVAFRETGEVSYDGPVVVDRPCFLDPIVDINSLRRYECIVKNTTNQARTCILSVQCEVAGPTHLVLDQQSRRLRIGTGDVTSVSGRLRCGTSPMDVVSNLACSLVR